MFRAILCFSAICGMVTCATQDIPVEWRAASAARRSMMWGNVFRFVTHDDQPRSCGEETRGILLVPNSAEEDNDAKKQLLGVVNRRGFESIVLVTIHQADRFELFLGPSLHKVFRTRHIQLPIETVTDKCFGVREADLSGVFCTKDRNSRNKFVNSITEEVLIALSF
eukprot:GHVL01023375.1.p1 GENE.GHVL01023375.1~~GHVL01023375.1.p1  ORF type:complete len:167 (+),score=12.79 GHVL01023375.1:32-532(+)